jgi:hypothetical protein
MPQEVVAMVQADADTLWWSREPELGAAKRVRRFVRGKTAIGQRKKGGLNNMDWKLHAEAFYAEWIVKIPTTTKISLEGPT